MQQQQNRKQRLLIIDDEENMRHMLSSLLSKEGYLTADAANGLEGLAQLRQNHFAFVLCDIKMPAMDGMGFLREAQAIEHSATIIMMSAFGTVDSAIEAMKLGAYDYISKPFKADEILLVLKKAEERERLKLENNTLRRQLAALEGEYSFGRMIGKSKIMQEVFRLAGKVARHTTTVLVTGESGTGKELVARGIHQASPWAGEPFVAINCGAIPENLIESELFGYTKGAFTGANHNKKGLFAEANRGTLFLDEIGELPMPMQVKLLRVLQENEIRPIGAARPEKIKVRIIGATAKQLDREVKEGRFRQDLFYRLNVVEIHIPPLRDRPEDIPLLCTHFITAIQHRFGKDITGISPTAMSLLMRHCWPGNVRELENVLERAVVLAEYKTILPENLPPELDAIQQSRRLDDFFGGLSLKKAKEIVERKLISRALESTGGNKSRAAVLLELSDPSLLSKMKMYDQEK